LSLNQKILVKVIGVEDRETPDRKKSALSVKQLENDPWESVDVQFKVGQKLKGKVTRIAQVSVLLSKSLPELKVLCISVK
jgi:ribosomal protein S1